MQAVILCTITGHKYIKTWVSVFMDDCKVCNGRLQSLQWTVVKLAMGDCKDSNGRLQSLQWTIVKITMGDCKDFNGKWYDLKQCLFIVKNRDFLL